MDSIGSTRTALVALTVAAVTLGGAAAAWTGERTPCGAPAAAAAPAAGWRVQIDPDTGLYSMPAPAPAIAPKADQARGAADFAVTPGTSPAGGYKIRLENSAASHQEQR